MHKSFLSALAGLFADFSEGLFIVSRIAGYCSFSFLAKHSDVDRTQEEGISTIISELISGSVFAVSICGSALFWAMACFGFRPVCLAKYQYPELVLLYKD